MVSGSDFPTILPMISSTWMSLGTFSLLLWSGRLRYAGPGAGGKQTEPDKLAYRESLRISIVGCLLTLPGTWVVVSGAGPHSGMPWLLAPTLLVAPAIQLWGVVRLGAAVRRSSGELGPWGGAALLTPLCHGVTQFLLFLASFTQ